MPLINQGFFGGREGWACWLAAGSRGMMPHSMESGMARETQLSFTTLGGEIVEVPVRGKHYVQPRGYFYPPGTGPKNETCGTCKHCARFKKWAKCELNRARWTGGRGSDILARSPACKYWETV